MPRPADGPGLSLARELTAWDQPVVITEAHTKWSKGWMARIEIAPARSRWRFERTWVDPADDRRNTAGNGLLVYDLRQLPDGVYEADSVERSGRSHRAYFRVADGRVAELHLNADEARAALAQDREDLPRGEASAYGRGEITVDSGCLLIVDPAYLDALLSPEGAKRLRELLQGRSGDREPVRVAPVPEAGPACLCAVVSTTRSGLLAVIEAFPHGTVEMRFSENGSAGPPDGESRRRHMR